MNFHGILRCLMCLVLMGIMTSQYLEKPTYFNISPPTAMFGQIETGNEITVVFDLVFIGI